MDDRFLGYTPAAWTALWAFLTLLALIAQVRIYAFMHGSTKRIERAYIGFGTWISEGEPALKAKRLLMTVQFHNFGNTPADIEGVLLTYDIGEHLPDRPPYYARPAIFESRRSANRDNLAFLVKRGSFVLWNQSFDIEEGEWASVTAPNTHQHLWLLGFVEYRDRFKQLHRAGYARVYEDGSFTPMDRFDKLPDTERLQCVRGRQYNYDVEIDDEGQPANND